MRRFLTTLRWLPWTAIWGIHFCYVEIFRKGYDGVFPSEMRVLKVLDQSGWQRPISWDDLKCQTGYPNWKLLAVCRRLIAFGEIKNFLGEKP